MRIILEKELFCCWHLSNSLILKCRARNFPAARLSMYACTLLGMFCCFVRFEWVFGFNF